MDVEDTEHFVSDRISKEKEQYWNGCSDKTRKQDNSKRKKNILEWINIRTSQETRISFSNERDSIT